MMPTPVKLALTPSPTGGSSPASIPGNSLDPSPVVWSSKTTRLPATVELVAP